MVLRQVLLGLAAAAMAVAASVPLHAADMPRYDHIFVIILENHTTNEIIDNAAAPQLTALSKQYGFASNFFAERHPSEPNYVALVGGDTFGIRDDDAFYCRQGLDKVGCAGSGSSNYVDHTVKGDNLASRLEAAGLTWKGYFEDIPEPGSLAYRFPTSDKPVAGKPDALYAVKHNGFMTFKTVQDDPKRAEKIVGFDALERDIAANTLPNFAHIVPNQCNDMHGLHGHDVPDDCTGKNSAGLIGRADRTTARIVGDIMNTPVWSAAGNAAIVITFDENDDDRSSPKPNGCCGLDTRGTANPGGGWIPTIVITNHGPRQLDDPTAYNHYSLLRTIEEAFGLHDHLRHAGDTAQGVVSMTPLFAVAPK